MPNKKSDVSRIQSGVTYLSETQYYSVASKDTATINVVNERDYPFAIANSIVEEGIYTSDQYNETIEVTRTELIDIFSKAGDTVFTVVFNKQPKAKDINIALANINKGKILSNAEISSTVKEVYEGKQRVLVGYLIKTETGFGRSLVIDLEADKGTNLNYDGHIRQVDHRTLQEFIQKNKRYIVK